ncbi:phosphatase PAP2 family protein [Eubacteriales bacterium KG127]
MTKKYFANKKSVKFKNLYLRLIIGVLALGIFIYVGWSISSVGRGPALFDDYIRFWIYKQRCEWLTPLVKGITYLGNWQTIFIISIILAIYNKTRFCLGIPAITVSLISVGIYSLLKIEFQRPRPDVALHLVSQGGWSFPSGHSMNCIVFYGTIFYILWMYGDRIKHRRLWLAMTGLLIPAIGVSRVYVGVHYPTDIVGGWTFGGFILILFSLWIDFVVMYKSLWVDKYHKFLK